MLSFMAWYAFPPLLARSIRADLNLSREQVLNSNIVALAAGFFMRFVVGPLCDAFGPRYVMVAILFCSAIPAGLAGTITNVGGLYAIRFFLGIAGASFVPCQVWCTGFYDKQVVGTANAFAAGWGNAGAGVTYFVMPAVFDSLVHDRGLTPHVSWRVAFIVPCILLIATGMGTLFLCDDHPNGKWQNRHLAYSGPSSDVEVDSRRDASTEDEKKPDDAVVTTAYTPAYDDENKPKKPVVEVVEKPSFNTAMKALACPQTLMLAAPYFCTFGGELAINSILSSYYLKHFPQWGQTLAGRWAAMFGLLNVITRPAGGLIADLIYKHVKPSWGVQCKKYWYAFCVFMQGVFCLWVGILDPNVPVTLVGGVAGIAIFMDAANGAAYALVPHVHPQVNGIMSGVVGGSGNLGGLVFNIVLRFVGYHQGIYIIGAVSAAVGAGICFIHPIPKSQRGGSGYMAS